MKYKIETERLILREFRESDSDDFSEMDSNPEVQLSVELAKRSTDLK